MNMHTTFIEQSQVIIELLAGINNIDSIYSKINFILHENLYPLEKDSYHFIGQLLKRLAPSDRTARALASTLFKTCYQAELLSAGGANITYLFGITLASELVKTPLSEENVQEVLDKFDFFINQLKIQFETNANTATPQDLEKIINETCGTDKVLPSAIWEAINLAGLEGKIFVEDGRQDNYFVELKEGYTFFLKPFKFMLHNNSWERRNCKVLIVDGLVEKVSEIDHLLTKSLETKIPMVVIAHGFSEEVVATLKANQERGLLDVQPVRIPSDIDALNVSNDIAVVCNTLPISSMKGDLVVFTKYDDVPIVDNVRLGEVESVITNSKTKAAVSAQVKSILEKRQSYFLHEEVQELFDKRLRSLISNTVLLHLPNASTIKNDERRVKIDVSLRQVKTILNYGTIHLHTEIEKFKDSQSFSNKTDNIGQFFIRLLVSFLKRLEDEKIEFVPTVSAIGGMMLAGKATILLLTSSGFVKFIEP